MNHHLQVGPASVPVQTPDSPFRSYRRHLPHWRNLGSTYFTTWRVARRQPDLSSGERDTVFAALRHFHQERYNLHACVVMNDHVHTLVEPFDSWPLEAIIHSWKSFTARQLQKQTDRQGALWQREYFDRLIRDEFEFRQKYEYIVGNPFKRWEGITEYRWLDWAGTEAGPTSVARLES